MPPEQPAAAPQRIPSAGVSVPGVAAPGVDAGVAVAEFAGTPRMRRTAPGVGWLLAARILLTVAAAASLMVAALAVGMRVDDRQVEAHLATATATVLSVSPLLTGIEFVDSSGITIRPPDGVLYPGLLSMSQRFQIEYSTLDPSVVRVAGRSATVGSVVLLETFAGIWLVALSGGWVLRRQSRRKRRAAALGPQEPAVSAA